MPLNLNWGRLIINGVGQWRTTFNGLYIDMVEPEGLLPQTTYT